MNNIVPCEGTKTAKDVPVKRLHTVQGKTFVVIAENLLRELKIDHDTFVEQEVVDQGILLKIKKFCGTENDGCGENVRA